MDHELNSKHQTTSEQYSYRQELLACLEGNLFSINSQNWEMQMQVK